MQKASQIEHLFYLSTIAQTSDFVKACFWNCDQVFPTPIGAMRSWGGYTLPPGIRSPPQCSGLVYAAKPRGRRLPVLRRGALVNIAYEQKRGGSEHASPSGILYTAYPKLDRT